MDGWMIDKMFMIASFTEPDVTSLETHLVAASFLTSVYRNFP